MLKIEGVVKQDWVHKLLPVVEKALGVKMVLPERKTSSVEKFIARYPKVKRVMIDGTERPIYRPKDLTFPVKCFGQAPSLHKGRVILTNHARELGFQWESYDDVQDILPDKQQPPLPKQ